MHETKGFFCSNCRKFHNEIPESYGSSAPELYYQIPEEELDSRVEMNDDLCVIDNKYFFIRGCIEIPILDKSDSFVWGVWVSLSEANFLKTSELWDVEGRENCAEPMFGWLQTSIPCYPETLNLKTQVYTRSKGARPLIELENTEHPLAIEQNFGISLERIKQVAEMLCDNPAE
jgi:hypothetical protein